MGIKIYHHKDTKDTKVEALRSIYLLWWVGSEIDCWLTGFYLAKTKILFPLNFVSFVSLW